MKKDIVSIILLGLFLLLGLSAIQAKNVNSNEKFTQSLIDRVKKLQSDFVLSKSFGQAEGKECLTMILYEAKRNWERLTNDGKAFFKVMLDRPSIATHYVETASGYFTIWFTMEGDDAVDLTDDNNNQVPDYVEMIAQVLEDVRNNCDTTGFILPPPDKGEGGDDMYDIYLSNTEAGEGVYGFVAPEYYVWDNVNSPTIEETTSSTSFMVLRSNYSGFGDGPVGEANALKVTVAHEFSHAIQFGYGGEIIVDNDYVPTMDGFFMEGCATWSEDWHYPGIDDNFQYMFGPFTETDFALNWDDNDEAGSENPLYNDYAGWWYGGWVFFRYLSEYENGGVVNPVVIKDLYEATVEVDYKVAIDNMMQDKYQLGFWDLITYYYMSLCILSPNQDFSPFTFSRANDYRNYLSNFGLNGVEPENTIDFTGNQVVYDSEVDGDHMLMRMGADILKINPSVDCEVTLTPKTREAGESYSLILLFMDAPSNPNLRGYLMANADSGSMSLTMPAGLGLSDYYIIIPAYFAEPALYNMQYTLTLSPTTDVEDDNLLPVEYELSQNFPNPFNPKSKIKFSIAKSGLVELVVYDLLGREVTKLVNEFKPAGNYTVDFNGENSPSGTYFYNLRTDGYSETKKMILLK